MTRAVSKTESMEHDVSQSVSEAEIRAQAERRLGMREHSRQELETWLRRRFGSEHTPWIEAVVGALVELGHLSDERYARMLSRHHVLRGKGPAYVQAKLREKGVRCELSQIRAWMSEDSAPQGQEVDPKEAELEQARRVVERRYPGFAQDPKLRARAFQALLRRGFSLEIARKSLENS